MARKRTPNEDKKGAAEWLLTYGDLVTLLLTFFVMLFSFSTIDAQKWQSLVSSLAGQSGILEGGKVVNDTPNTGDNPSIDDFLELFPGGSDNLDDFNGNEDSEYDDNDEFVRLYKAIEGFLEEKGIPAEVKISGTHTEILLRFKDSVLFDSGAANIKHDAKEILKGVSQVLKEFHDHISRVRIDGHADIRPVDPRKHPTNWELSAERAVNVVRYFCEDQGFEASKLSAAAYGEFHPIEDDRTEEGLSRNRRVEIFIVRVVDSEEVTELDR
ncbi:MAG TPA: OmpA family protein [Clostridia bacterium]|nr:OmpA family protein [Clostridia bacterium]